jgi:hypothetical protein
LKVFDLVAEVIEGEISHPTHDVCILNLDATRMLFWKMEMSGRYFPIVKQLFENIVDTTHKFAFEE